MSSPDEAVKKTAVPKSPMEGKTPEWMMGLLKKGQTIASKERQRERTIPDKVIVAVKKQLPTHERAEKLRIKAVAKDLAEQGFSEADIHAAINGDENAIARLNTYKKRMNQGQTDHSSAIVKDFFEKTRLIPRQQPTPIEGAASDSVVRKEKFQPSLLKEIAHDRFGTDELSTEIVNHAFTGDQEAIDNLLDKFPTTGHDPDNNDMRALYNHLQTIRDYKFASKDDQAVIMDIVRQSLGRALGDSTFTSKDHWNKKRNIMNIGTTSFSKPEQIHEMFKIISGEIDAAIKSGQEVEVSEVVIDGIKYQVSTDLTKNPNLINKLTRRLQLSKDQITYDNQKARIDSLPRSLDKQLKQELTLALHPHRDDYSADDLESLRQELLAYSDYEDSALQGQINLIDEALKQRMTQIGGSVDDRFTTQENNQAEEYLKDRAEKINKSLGDLMQIIHADTFNPKEQTPTDLLKLLKESGNEELRDMALFLEDNPDFQSVLAELVVQAKITNTESELHDEWQKLRDKAKSPEEMMNDLIDPSEAQKIILASQARLKELVASGKDIFENGKLKMSEAGKAVMETIKKIKPEWLTIKNVAIAIIVVLAVIIIGGLFLGSQAVGQSR